MIGLPSFIMVEMRDKCIIGNDLLRKTILVDDVARGKLLWETGRVDLVVQGNIPVVYKVTTLINQYQDLFVNGPIDELRRTTVAEHSIDTGETRPLSNGRTEHLYFYREKGICE